MPFLFHHLSNFNLIIMFYKRSWNKLLFYSPILLRMTQSFDQSLNQIRVSPMKSELILWYHLTSFERRHPTDLRFIVTLKVISQKRCYFLCKISQSDILFYKCITIYSQWKSICILLIMRVLTALWHCIFQDV